MPCIGRPGMTIAGLSIRLLRTDVELDSITVDLKSALSITAELGQLNLVKALVADRPWTSTMYCHHVRKVLEHSASRPIRQNLGLQLPCLPSQ